MKKHHYQSPHPSLSEYVRTVLIMEGFAQADANDLPLVTKGMPAFICRTERDRSGKMNVDDLVLFGKSSSSKGWEAEGATIVAYFFKPFAMPPLFNVPAVSLTRAPVDLRDRFPHKANALVRRLMCVTTTSDQIEILNDFLILQLKLNLRECEIVRYATDHIMYDPGTGILTDIQKKLNVNERTFQRIFRKYVGVTPSLYRRICQFQLSFAQVRSKKFESLSAVAYDNGFSDQSHFIRSFREFTSTTPNDYLKSGLKGGTDIP